MVESVMFIISLTRSVVQICSICVVLLLFSGTTTQAIGDDSPHEEPVVSTQQRSVEVNNLPSLSARHVRWHQPSDTELLSADIELSAQGLRVRQVSPGNRHNEMLQNFVSNEAWLIDHRRSMAHRLPLEDDMTDAAAKPADAASFLSQEPCGASLNKSDAGRGLWRGRGVSAWHCENENGQIVTIEFIDDEYGIVVYRRADNGKIDELRDLQKRQYGSEHFRPASRLRFVTRQEFFGEAPAIPPYKETE